jgi:hypothetical protein
MSVTQVKSLRLQRFFDVQSDLLRFEVLADGEVVADVTIREGEPRLALFRHSQAVECDARQFIDIMKQALDALEKEQKVE